MNPTKFDKESEVGERMFAWICTNDSPRFASYFDKVADVLMYTAKYVN